MELASQEIEDNLRNILPTIDGTEDLDELECIADSGHEVCAPTLEAPTQLSQDLENILQRFLAEYSVVVMFGAILHMLIYLSNSAKRFLPTHQLKLKYSYCECY